MDELQRYKARDEAVWLHKQKNYKNQNRRRKRNRNQQNTASIFTSLNRNTIREIDNKTENLRQQTSIYII